MAIGVAVLVAVLVVSSFNHRRPEPALRIEKQFGRFPALPVRDDNEAPPADPKKIDLHGLIGKMQRELGLPDPALQKEIEPLFAEIGDALKKGDEQRLAKKISGVRFLEELVSFAGLNRHEAAAAGIRGQADSIERSIAQVMVRDKDDWKWSEFVIKRVVPIDERTARILTRHKTARGSKIITWWAAKRRIDGQVGWFLFDFEAQAGIRVTLRFSKVADRLQFQGRPAGLTAIENLREAEEILNSDLTVEGGNRADRVLDRIPVESVPRPLLAAYRWQRMLIRWRRQNYDQALAENDQCRQAEPSRPSHDLYAAMILNDMKKPAEVLPLIERLHRDVGETSDSWRELGMALSALGRNPEARTAYRKCLDDLPDEPENFLSFLRSIDSFQAEDDVGPRFAKLSKAADNYEQHANDCKSANDFESLRQLAIVMGRISPASPLAKEHLALAEAQRDLPAKALATFRAAMALEPDAGHRSTAASDFLKRMAQSGHAIEAYRDLADAPKAVIEPGELFRGLAEWVHSSYRQRTLRRLVRLHGAKHPDDPFLLMCRGEILENDGKDAEADAAFTKAAAQLNERPQDRAFVATFSHVRTTVRYRLGKLAETLEEFEPRNQVFQDLASLCLQEKKYELLDELLDRYLKLEPDNLVGLRWRMANRIRQGKTEEGIALYRKQIAKEPEQERSLTNQWFFTAMVDKKLAVEAYRAADDPKKAFTFLGNDLEGMGHWTELDALMDAHRVKHADDPMLHVIAGRRLVQAKEWTKAIDAYKAAEGHVDTKTGTDPRREAIYARYKAGLAIETCREIEPRNQTFAQLANLAIGDRDWPLLEKLIAEHRGTSPDDPSLDEATARLLVYRKKPAEAAEMIRKVVKQRTTTNASNPIVQIAGYDPWQMFFNDAVNSDQSLEAYEAAPDKKIAFERIAVMLSNRSKKDVYAQLVERHAKEPTPSPSLTHHRGVVHLLRREYPAAERELRKAYAGYKPNERFVTRTELFRACIEQGKTAELFREFDESDPDSLREIVSQCIQRKRGDQLKAILEIERNDPDREQRGIWKGLSWTCTGSRGTTKPSSANSRSVRPSTSSRPTCGGEATRFAAW